MATAPAATTARKATEKRIELGERRRTTSFLDILRLMRTRERFRAWVLRSENVRVSAVSASMRAVEVEMEERFLKKNGIMEKLGSLGREMGGLGDL